MSVSGHHHHQSQVCSFLLKFQYFLGTTANPISGRRPLNPNYLVLLPQRKLRLLLLKFLRTLHHKIDDVDAAGQREQDQDVGQDAQADENRSGARDARG